MTQRTTEMVRLDARIPRGLQLQIRRAAELRGLTVTGFLTDVMQKASAEIIEREHVIRLTLEEQQRFARALIDPGEPNDAMRAAFSRYHAAKRDGV